MKYLTLTLLLLTASPLLAQRGGFGGDRGQSGGGGPPSGGGFGGDRGGGFGRGGSMSPDDSFNRLLSSYGGTGDVVDFSRVSPESRERYNRFAQMTNTEPMPAAGTISRAQYADLFNKRMEAMKAGGGFGGGGFNRGGGPSATPAPAPGATVTMSVQPAPSAVPVAPQERVISEEDLGRTMRKYDSNDDGRVSAEEAQRSDRLRPIFAHYDSNKDGIWDMNELRVYANDRMNNRGPAGDSNQNGGGPPGGGNYPPPGGGGGYYDQGRDSGRDRNATPSEEERPLAIRYGKLPKGLPSWFESLDTDKDGQIGLYEWRAKAEFKQNMSEFLSYDLNSDGLLTAEEYLRAKKIASAAPVVNENGEVIRAATMSTKDSAKSSDSRFDKGRPEKPSKEDKKDDKKEDKRDYGKGGNPFRTK